MPSKLKTYVFVPACIGAVIGLIGLIAVWAGIPLLFASLGPSVAIQASSPQQPIAQPWNVAVGHLLALGLAVGAVYATGAIHDPSFLDGHALTFDRVGAAALGVTMGVFAEFLLKASHPPAAATSLLVTLGAVEIDGQGIVAVICGIALVAALGEAVRRLQSPLRGTAEAAGS